MKVAKICDSVERAEVECKRLHKGAQAPPRPGVGHVTVTALEEAISQRLRNECSVRICGLEGEFG